MPFVEIVNLRDRSTVSIKAGRAIIPKKLREEYIEDRDFERVRIYIDRDSNLLGLMPSEKGFKMSYRGVIFADIFKGYEGTFPVRWDDVREMFIVDLNV